MSKLSSIITSTAISGGVIHHGSMSEYISDAARRAAGLESASLKDGQVIYLAKNLNILKRAAVQAASQMAYGQLRSYPRYIKYLEQKRMERHIQNLDSSITNKDGQYYKLIEGQRAVAKKKNYTDSIVGDIQTNPVLDYLELSVSTKGADGNVSKTIFVDLQAIVSVSSKNNIVLNQVQGRRFTRKEYISGGDYEISISGKITSKYPDVFPEAEMSKFLFLINHIGAIDCENTILQQYNIKQLIITGHNIVPNVGCRNSIPYTFTAVAVEPADEITVKSAEVEKADTALKSSDAWIDVLKYGTAALDPTFILKMTKQWI